MNHKLTNDVGLGNVFTVPYSAIQIVVSYSAKIKTHFFRTIIGYDCDQNGKVAKSIAKRGLVHVARGTELDRARWTTSINRR